jgi:hypothetical protein
MVGEFEIAGDSKEPVHRREQTLPVALKFTRRSAANQGVDLRQSPNPARPL